MFLLARFARERFSMRDLEQAAALLEAAGRDLSALRGMGNKPDFANEVFGFHVQQAAEKSLKAWLSLLGEDYPATHDLAWLLEMLRQQGAQTKSFEGLIDYNPYAVQFRYVADSSVKPIDRNMAVERVEALMEHVRRLFTDPGEASDDK